MSLTNEVRIGNWVEILGDSKRLDFFTTIQPSSFSVNIDKTYGPIPLDEEWLLKFGFQLYDYLANDEMSDNPDFIYLSYKMELEGKRYYYSITNTEFHDWEFCQKVEWAEEMLIASCQYVHQLQNLYFALTGTELQFQNDQPNL